ncbi:MAG: cytochrome C oxidase subunit IV family protein [Acidobacteria bacterium]|nr:cytochrome C oxidase subunit IV family protein [Acidobacteriota bacterium]
MKAGSEPGLALYWRTWLALLALTLVMVFLDQAAFPRSLIVGILITAMLVKASLVGAYFMHLRFEKVALVATVIAGLLVTGSILFFLIAPDGMRILERSPR